MDVERNGRGQSGDAAGSGDGAVEELRRASNPWHPVSAPCAVLRPRPVIINVHGGPDQRERPRPLGRSNYFRNEMGIAIIYPNIGLGGLRTTFEQADNGLLRENAVRPSSNRTTARLRENALKDIGALLDWIATDASLDKNRVMIVGRELRRLRRARVGHPVRRPAALRPGRVCHYGLPDVPLVDGPLSPGQSQRRVRRPGRSHHAGSSCEAHLAAHERRAS